MENNNPLDILQRYAKPTTPAAANAEQHMPDDLPATEEEKARQIDDLTAQIADLTGRLQTAEEERAAAHADVSRLSMELARREVAEETGIPLTILRRIDADTKGALSRTAYELKNAIQEEAHKIKPQRPTPKKNTDPADYGDDSEGALRRLAQTLDRNTD